MRFMRKAGAWLTLLTLSLLCWRPTPADEPLPPSRAAARSHVEFMRFLGESQVPLDSLPWTEELLDDCHLDNHELGIVRLQNWEWIAKPYLRDLCGPLATLLEPLAPCEAKDMPAWCRRCDEIVAKMDLDGYFEEMEQALAAGQQELTRFNILFLMTELLYWMPENFKPSECDGAADRWFRKSVTFFLKGAHPGDVPIIEKQLRGLFKDLPETITREFRAYRASPPEARDENEVSPSDTAEP